tara:strand:+ start:159 stop:785 length:627 start_codon:yes stop_codon:yes gene_type:complete
MANTDFKKANNTKLTSVTQGGLKYNLDNFHELAGKAVWDAAADPLTPGTGISDSANTTYYSWRERFGNIVKTSIYIDLTDLASGGSANDIIGDDGGAANCHIGQYTTAVMGTMFAVRMQHLELAAGGDPDINLVSADEATLAENSAFGSATNGVTLINGGDGTATDNTKLGETTMANANQYLYLTCGASTDAAYTAGKVLIEIFGVLS